MQNTIDILSSINITVKEIAKSMAPQNGSGEAAMSKLSKGNVTTNADVNPAADVAKPNISKANIGDIISVLNTLSPTVLNIAKISRSQINRFTKVLDTIIKSVNKLSECAKNNKDSVSNVKIIIESFDILNDSVGKGSGLVIKAPIATLGLKLVNDTIKAIDAILKTVSKMSNVNDRIKKLNKIYTRDLEDFKITIGGSTIYKVYPVIAKRIVFTTNDIVEECKLHINSVNKVLNKLVEQGYLVKEKRKGTNRVTFTYTNMYDILTNTSN